MASAANGCEYCQQHHGAALNNYWNSKERVQSLRINYQTAALTVPDTLLCRFAIELTVKPNDFVLENRTENLRQGGFDDRAILDATMVVAYFNFVNRIVMTLGVQLEAKAGERYKY